MPRMDAQFTAELNRRAQAGLRRTAAPTPPNLLNFSSNDYLGLARHPHLAERAAAYAHAYGAGATASRLVCGTLPIHTALETRIATHKGREAAMLLATGWQANAAVLGALLRFAGPETLLFADELNHSSLVHGARIAGIKPIRFRHNNIADLEQRLIETAANSSQRFIVTESVFSMDGDRADIARLRALAERHNAFLYIDEAHATGVLGPNGMGLCAHEPGIDLVMGTFSKALGGFGAYIAGSRPLIDFLQNACAGFIYTTAPPPPVLGAIDAALDLVPHMHAERARLAGMATRVRAAFAEMGVNTAASSTQIIPAMMGSAETALRLAADLRAQGVLAVPIRPPTVPEGTSRIRFALSAAHSDADIDRLITAMRACWPSLRCAA